MIKTRQTASAAWPDYIRRPLNLILPPAMWILSSLGFWIENARTAGEFSDLSQNLLVPLGPAFSIWFPIFVGCIIYGVVQALPKNRTRDVFRRSGWSIAAGFFLICGWAMITAFAPSSSVQWGTALIFIPAVAALIHGMIVLSGMRQELSKMETYTVLAPISLIAGWCSLAVFLNWTPIAYDVFADGSANILTSLLILAAALGLIILICRRSSGNWIYVVPALWGLAWLAIRHLPNGTAAIGVAAIVGFILLAASAWALNRQSKAF